MSNGRSQSGFTLVELAIVLVIIGLIVGGVLAGQALIVAAKIRAQMTQLDQFDAGINAFRGKYGCLPGDCLAGEAPSNAATTPANAQGDGNIDYVAAAAATDESSVAWAQLQTAGVVVGNYVPAGAGASYSGGMPVAKAGGRVVLGGASGTNYYLLGGSYTNSPVGWTNIGGMPAVTASAIDKKRDDEAPGTGLVLSQTPGNGNFFTTSSLPTAVTDPVTDCTTIVGGLPSAYQSGSDTAQCLLRVRISG